MPLEIRELVIRANLERGRTSQKQSLTPADLERLKDRVVAECMERLKEQLVKDKMER